MVHQPNDASQSICPWAASDPLYRHYHDHEWGVPLTDDLSLFSLLMLEAMQAGLSWLTILRRRDALLAAFEQFNPERLAIWGPEQLEQQMHNPLIIRNRRKIEAAVTNARAFLRLRQHTTFSQFLWSFVGGQPQISQWQDMRQVPTATEASRAMSQALKQQGFFFAGPVICYAFMQSAGLVWDHLADCPRWSWCRSVDYRKLWPDSARRE
ncbi:MAG: DNA-3-methyladenine glycosylase I [Eubacteriales bacterium]|nr:DNA-3-methyladenine glycosylase I [Eubacteriales bacterium]